MMAFLLVVVGVVLALLTLYVVYTLSILLRLWIEAIRLKRACEPRGFTITWSFFSLWFDVEDPYCLTVTLHKDERTFEFVVFRSGLSVSPSWTFTNVKIAPLALASQLRGRVCMDPKEHIVPNVRSHDVDYEPIPCGIDEIDARYALHDRKAEANTPDARALLHAAFAHGAVQKHLVDYDGRLVFTNESLHVSGGRSSEKLTDFCDGLVRVAHLANGLDDAVKNRLGPYR